MRRYTRDAGMYSDTIKQLKDKYYDTLGHIFEDEILVLIDTEFEIKPPKAKAGEEPSEEAVDKWKDKKRKAWKFNMKTVPKLYQDALDSRTQFIMIVRRSLVDELSEAQVVAHIFTELRKINTEYKLEKPDVHTFSDLARLIGRPDWEQAYDVPNLLEIEEAAN
jgi:hypothetical protein